MKKVVVSLALFVVLATHHQAVAQTESSIAPDHPYWEYYREAGDLRVAALQDDDDASPSDRYGPNANQNPMSDDPMNPDDGSGNFMEFGCESYFGQCGCGSQCGARSCGGCDHWRLIQLNGTRIEVGGWLSGGVTVADHNVASTNPVAFVNPTDEFLFNQLWVFAERQAQTCGCGVDWGFRIDYVFGADGPDTQAFGDQGWDFGWNSGGTGGNTYGSAIPQAYGELAINRLSIKMGRFFTLIGHESVASPNNFFYSHTYMMNYGEPFTHTGFVAEYALHDHIDVFGGYTFGWDSGFGNFLNAHTFLGGVDMRLSDAVSVAYMLNAGDFGDGTAKNGVAGSAGDIFLNSLVATVDLSCRLQYIAQADYGRNDGFGSPNNEWYGLSQYLIYRINQCWAAGMRYEAFRDHAGTAGRVTNNAETYHAWTMGANWQPSRNVVVRPEVRWDYVDHQTAPYGGQNSLFTFGVDAIFRY